MYRMNLSAGFVTPPRRILLTRVTNRMAKTSNLRRFVTRMTRRVATGGREKRFVETVITVGKNSGGESHLNVCVGWGAGRWGGGGGEKDIYFNVKNSNLSHLSGREKNHPSGKTVISVTSVGKQLSQSPLWENS